MKTKRRENAEVYEIADKLPCDTEAEKTLLSAILCGHPHTAEIFDMLDFDDFYDSRHVLIFKHLKKLWDKGQLAELPALADSLTASKRLETAGGIEYVAGVAEPVPFKTRVDLYSQNVRGKRVLREFMKACQDWTETINNDNPVVGDLLDEAKERISALAMQITGDGSGKTFKEASVNLIAILKEPESVGMLTGISEVDERTGGFKPGELCIITADTGVGKTFFALQIARKTCALGKHLLYCSGEMLAEHLMGRVLSSRSGVAYEKIRKPRLLNEIEFMKLLELATKQCPDCKVADGELSLPKIRLAARSMPHANFGGVMVDYDELVEVRGKDEWEQQRILIRSMKSLAMELKVPVLVVSQLRKLLSPEERKRPTLQRLYGSGSKAKHASIVLYVERPFVQQLTGDETEAKVYILKNRDGRMGQTNCSFNIHTLTFEQRQNANAK